MNTGKITEGKQVRVKEGRVGTAAWGGSVGTVVGVGACGVRVDFSTDEVTLPDGEVVRNTCPQSFFRDDVELV